MINTAIWSGLRYFHAVAEQLSFTRAAEVLNVTTGAVSQQVKQLESRLGYSLFKRTTRQLRLTEQGKHLAQAFSLGYRAIDEALAVLTSSQLRGRLRLVVIPSFCLQWLVPRLGEFYRTFPDIDLHIDARDQLQGLVDAGYDLAIDYRVAISGDQSPFLAEWLIPVCSPDLLIDGKPLAKAENLLGYPLLHDSAPWIGAGRDEEWLHWLDQTGVNPEPIQGQLYFNRADLALQAAEAGHGIALGRRALIADQLASGRLVIAYDQSIRSPASYFLQTTPGGLDNTRVLAFQHWLLSLVKTIECV